MSPWVALVVVAYALLAGPLVWKLLRHGSREPTSHREAVERLRVARAAGAYAVLPLLVAIHLGGHALGAWIAGTDPWTEIRLVLAPVRGEETGALGTGSVVGAASAVLAVPLACLGTLAWVLLRPSNAAWNLARVEAARAGLWLALLVHPLASWLARAGDPWLLWQSLDARSAPLGTLLGCAWVAAGVTLTWLRRSPIGRRIDETCTLLHDVLRDAERRLVSRPDDPGALRVLVRGHLARGRPDAALGAVGRAVRARPRAPEVHYLDGALHLALGRLHHAASSFRSAGQLLGEATDPADRVLQHEVILGLAVTRLRLGDPEGALLTLEAVDDALPSDGREELIRVDALLALGRLVEAHERLVRALSRAQGTLAVELGRRLAALRARGVQSGAPR
ncbi:MAG: hypothetical protein NZ898_12675 [Myxococcota bacterium]|nr:hypothetical protein [Myxococcota bacterium]MDW8361815.1 hypothetical protein [Myxococcales bacterium]